MEAETRKELKELKNELELGEPVVEYQTKQYYSTMGCKIYYIRRPEMDTALEKLEFLRTHKLEDLEFERIVPDKNNNWINIVENDWDSLLQIQKAENKNEQMFTFASNGVNTARDEWVFDYDYKKLKEKIKFFIISYSNQVYSKKLKGDELTKTIKWSEALKNSLKRGLIPKENFKLIRNFNYRPFKKVKYYSEKTFSDRLTSNHRQIFGNSLQEDNFVITFSGLSSSKPFSTLASNILFGFDFIEKTQSIPLYRYNTEGERTDNITDWGLQQFRNYYKIVSQVIKPKKEPIDYSGSIITKEDIFHYVYAVLHHPAYRKKYELNLKREFPRIPFYDNFFQWADGGKTLMDLHINYETVKPFDLKLQQREQKTTAKKLRIKAEESEELYGRQPRVKAKLKADKENGIIELDELSFLTGIPKAAWDYKLGNRSALEWILDQYKEKKPTDPTIAEKFNTYLFADYKEHVIELLKRVCTVSVQTVKIVNSMPGYKKQNNLFH